MTAPEPQLADLGRAKEWLLLQNGSVAAPSPMGIGPKNQAKYPMGLKNEANKPGSSQAK